MVTPPVPSRSKSVSRDLSFRKKKVEGVTKDLDPVRKHLEESSSQFRQGLTCFLIMVLHTYLTWQACAILPGQRLFEPNWFILLVQKRFDPESLCKLAGSHTCLNLPEPSLFKQLLTRQACTSFPGQKMVEPSWLNKPLTRQTCTGCWVKTILNQVGSTNDPASLYKLAGSKVCLNQVGSTNL